MNVCTSEYGHVSAAGPSLVGSRTHRFRCQSGRWRPQHCSPSWTVDEEAQVWVVLVVGDGQAQDVLRPSCNWPQKGFTRSPHSLSTRKARTPRRNKRSRHSRRGAPRQPARLTALTASPPSTSPSMGSAGRAPTTPQRPLDSQAPEPSGQGQQAEQEKRKLDKKSRHLRQLLSERGVSRPGTLKACPPGRVSPGSWSWATGSEGAAPGEGWFLTSASLQGKEERGVLTVQPLHSVPVTLSWERGQSLQGGNWTAEVEGGVQNPRSPGTWVWPGNQGSGGAGPPKDSTLPSRGGHSAKSGGPGLTQEKNNGVLKVGVGAHPPYQFPNRGLNH